MKLILAGGDLGGSEMVGLLLLFVILPIAVIFVFLKVFLGRKDGQ